ncbi:MAG: hypothetical protein F6K31_09625 [Symploca sp. SIO2G7]|nr:hypothetical protein [Symploca sp. SIO2G7]
MSNPLPFFLSFLLPVACCLLPVALFLQSNPTSKLDWQDASSTIPLECFFRGEWKTCLFGEQGNWEAASIAVSH